MCGSVASKSSKIILVLVSVLYIQFSATPTWSSPFFADYLSELGKNRIRD